MLYRQLEKRKRRELSQNVWHLVCAGKSWGSDPANQKPSFPYYLGGASTRTSSEGFLGVLDLYGFQQAEVRHWMLMLPMTAEQCCLLKFVKLSGTLKHWSFLTAEKLLGEETCL